MREGSQTSPVGAPQGAITSLLRTDDRALRRSYAVSGQCGFTLIEMVLVIAMLGALLALGGVFIIQPFQAYEDVARRARLVDVAETAMMRMTRETRMALPNSVRIDTNGTRYALEFLATSTGGRYRQQVDDTGAGDPLDRTLAADSFDVLGGWRGEVKKDDMWLVIYNTGDTGLDAYNGDNIAPITAVGADSLSFDKRSAPAFPADSPQGRFYVVTGPVSFVCDANKRTLRRYAGYAIQAAQPMSDAALGGGGSLLATNVENCNGLFAYEDGGGSRNGLVTFRLTVTEAGAGETISLLQQAHVLNIP